MVSTLFAKISLKDRLTVQAKPRLTERLSLQITGPLAAGLSANDDNLVLRAVRAFEQEFNLPLQADIILEKNIPMGAGLGGGSSDAGTVMRALCRMFGKDPLLLLPRAAKLGADVPLFLYPDTFLKGEGIGEKLTPVKSSGCLPWIVLVYPDTAVPTKGVFSRLVLPNKTSVLTNCANLDKLLIYLREGRPLLQWQELLFNRLEEAVLPYVCSVRDAKKDFSDLGTTSLMSGSGSTVFALFDTQKQAENLAKKISPQGRKVFVTHFGETANEDN